jgi:hypothetical protein
LTIVADAARLLPTSGYKETTVATERDDDLVKRLRAGFRAGEPDQATEFRILHTIMARQGSAEQAGGARAAEAASTARAGALARAGAARRLRPTLGRRALRLAPVIGGLAVAILVAAILIDVGSPPDAALVTKRALAAVKQPGTVMYYKMMASFVDLRDPSAIGKSDAEYWLDQDTGTYRYRVANLATEKGGIVYGLTKGGTQPAITLFAPVSASGSSSDWGSPSGTADQYEKLLSSGKATLLGKEKIGTVETYKLQIVSETSLGDMPIKTIDTINVRTSDYLPVRAVEEKTASIESQQVGTKQTIDLVATKSIAPASLADDFFSLQAPADNEHVEGTLTLDQLRSFKGFELFWLGDSFRGMKPGKASYSREKLGVEKTWPDYRIQLEYAGGNAELTITVSPKVGDALVPQLLAAESTTTTINGRTAYVAATSTGAKVALTMTNSTVVIAAADKAAALEAAEKLAKLN